MGCRRQPRVPMTLSVSLCGMDAKGRAFVEHVRTRDISRDGGQLEGVLCALKIGDPVALRYNGSTSRFRVVWEKAGAGKARSLGLARCGASALSVDCELPGSGPDDYLRPRLASRRLHPRFKCEVSVEVKLRDAQNPLWVTTGDVGEGGCRVQVPQMVPPLSEVNVGLWLEDSKVWVEGIVTHSLYGWGTGIKFRGLHEDAREKLARIVSQQDGEVSDRRVSIEPNLVHAGDFKGMEIVPKAAAPEDALLELLLER
jgi:PilZ domain